MKPEPLTESERIYAESVKYGSTVIMLIPLPSGRFAVMGAGRKIDGAVPGATSAADLEVTQPQIRRVPTSPYLNPLRHGPDLNIEIEL